ncbi:alpha/beta hydrolase [Dokdonella fugitiva]|jgi:pimeloyl-ACP methyl ester carboxylesterase|uniref:alpha/beta hydrolase n=1 Tax=Dokdonella fugitiva TaxID=328517 RepID=UPI0015FB83C8|nr:alpha/beta hydrolase [Dokdonella fugitiva]MBA8883757.1 pimeloyl-ACP methyl ester carboxylesterase [Dokdonella fugitiva]
MRCLSIIVLCSLLASNAFAATVATETGSLEGASYRVDVPAGWKKGGGLVVFFHGYSDEPVAYAKDDRLSPMFDPVLREGYAVIQSGYSRPGWAIEQGSADSERLRRWFVAKHGAPGHTYAMGMSMGGSLTVHALETHPDAYDGGLSLCGAIEPSDRMMQRDFAVRAAFDYYFPGVLGELVPVPATFAADQPTAVRVARAMRADPKASASLRALYGAGDMDNLPGVIAAITYDIKEMQQRTRGNPFGNADLVYTGSTDDDALNDGVRRYRADPKAAAYVSRWYTPSGKLTRPLLALHDTRDPLVIASSAFEYALMLQRTGHADNFVQQYVKREGHCVFTPEQIGKAFDSLVEWTRGGKRPPSGAQP